MVPSLPGSSAIAVRGSGSPSKFGTATFPVEAREATSAMSYGAGPWRCVPRFAGV